MSYLPIEPFEINRVEFVVVAIKQPPSGIFAMYYYLMRFLTGKQTIHLRLYALTDQEAARSLTAMEKMEKHGAKFAKRAAEDAQKRGYIVADRNWEGIVHPDNLDRYIEDPDFYVWRYTQE